MIKKFGIFGRILTGLLKLFGYKLVALLNAFISRKGYSIYADIAYGVDPRQKLDIYIPAKLASPKTTIIYFHGGSWQLGDKNMYRFLGQAFASKGFITVIVNYRLYPQVYFPAFMDDSAKAVGWVHRNIQQYGGSPNHVFLAGHSAGAHIAALLITDEHYLSAQNSNVSWLKGMIGIAGPYDFLPFNDLKIKALFSKVHANDTQPINYVKSGLPPFFLASGNTDKEVLPKNTLNFANRLRHFNVPITEKIYPEIGHMEIILALAAGFRYRAPLLADITNFINAANNQ